MAYVQALAWPTVTATLVLFFFLRFRGNVANFFDRVTEARGPGGLGVVAAPPPSQEITADETAIDINVVQELVDTYEEQLQQAHQQHEQSVQQLQEAVIVARLELDFERTYRLILGSQIRALNALADADPVSVPRTLIEPIFEAAKSQWPAPLASWMFEGWMSFLLRPGYTNQALVEQLGDGTYRITQKGNAFLGYIQAKNYPAKIF